MFKEKFNTLAVTIEEFALKEKTQPDFDKVSDQIFYYKSLVDEYYYIRLNLENVLTDIDSNIHPGVYQEVAEKISELDTIFEPYKSEFIVSSYIKEIESFYEKNKFFEKLFKYEKMLVEKPIIKIEVDIIQDILVYAREYTNVSTTYYFFANNPFNVDTDLGIIIPEKMNYENAEKFLAGFYNYVYGLYNQYKNTNSEELIQLELVENSILEKIYQFGEDLRKSKNNKYHAEYGTLPGEYYEKTNIIINDLRSQLDGIVESGVYRFYSLSKKFTEYESQYQEFISEYTENPLYVEYVNTRDYNTKLDQLQEFITLLEDGKINSDKDYILTDINLKELVDSIIKIAKDNNKKIYYTQKYHETGIPTRMEYEFYQTAQFLSDIKKYYYGLMTENIQLHTKLSIDDLGDDTITEYKTIYKSVLAKYTMFLNQDNTFMNDFEVQQYLNELESLQDKLKIAAMNFFDGANKTSPLTFTDTIEQLYNDLLNKLKYDLEYAKSKNNIDIIKLNVDPNRQEALEKLREIEKHNTNLVSVLDIGRRYVFLDMVDFVQTNIQIPYNEIYNRLKTAFNKEEYIRVINDYDKFYKTSIFDFNMLYALEKLAESTEKIFGRIDLLNQLYIDEQISEKPKLTDTDAINYIQDLFDDETYKVVRNEIFGRLDIFYEYVISVRQNEKPFLINEKNLKKVYFDNQLIKINYIGLYHKVIQKKAEFDIIKVEASKYEWFQSENKTLQTFDYKSRLETLILNQNRILSEITKMIVEYGSDNNFNTVDVTGEAILNIETYNKMFEKDIEIFITTINKIIGLLEYEKLKSQFDILVGEHTKDWKDLILNNEIPEPEKVSYTDMDVFKGNVPFMVELEAKPETLSVGDDENGVATFTWDLGGGVTKSGEKVSHTFYEEGLHKVKCDMTFESGETSTRFLEFDVSGATNSQIVKSDTFKYAPLNEYEHQTLISYYDPETSSQVSLLVNISGNAADMIKDGTLTFEESDAELKLSRHGLVILGFEGTEFAGQPYDNKQIFSEDFELPEEAEFLFDFKVSHPIMNRSVIDISSSKFIDYIAKVSPEQIKSVYEIDDASKFQKINGTTVAIMTGDLLVMKNKMNRYAVVRVSAIREILEPEPNKYYFEIEFEVYVNVSLNNFERTVFKPLETSLVVPTLVFKTNVRELFNALVSRLEEINHYRDELAKAVDTEKKLTLTNKINVLERENSKYYLFEEFNKLTAKVTGLVAVQQEIWSTCNIDDENFIDTIQEKNQQFKTQLENSKSFSDYMNGINVYDFRKNIVDLDILVELYQDQLLAMEILIDTYNFKKYDGSEYFVKKVMKLKHLPQDDKIELSNPGMMYTKKLGLLVLKLRDFIFKIKLITNFPIMSAGKHIMFSQNYTRPMMDESTGKYTETKDHDLFLLNKKLELMFGWETEKVEMGAMFDNFVEDMVIKQKETFGTGLSDDELENLSKYIQTVETRAVEEYDDFFMIPFWLDYLDKLNF